MSVRAKFFCQKVTPTVEEAPEAPSRQVSFSAVCRGAANRQWSSATPAGSISMNIRNDAATTQFEVGKEYYVDFTPAEAAPTRGDGHEAQPGLTAWNTLACEACGMGGSWVKVDGTTGYAWDDDAQGRHDEAYGVPASE